MTKVVCCCLIFELILFFVVAVFLCWSLFRIITSEIVYIWSRCILLCLLFSSCSSNFILPSSSGFLLFVIRFQFCSFSFSLYSTQFLSHFSFLFFPQYLYFQSFPPFLSLIPFFPILLSSFPFFLLFLVIFWQYIILLHFPYRLIIFSSHFHVLLCTSFEIILHHPHTGLYQRINTFPFWLHLPQG